MRVRICSTCGFRNNLSKVFIVTRVDDERVAGEIKGSGIYEPNIGCGSFSLLTDKENIIKDLAKNYEKLGIKKVTYVTNLPSEYFENDFEKY
ncbi:MAG TPA: hypothetical protein EYP03_04595, partial [Aquificae bacterium]|nr:hypothetical protein [Aquificota bacterium]